MDNGPLFELDRARMTALLDEYADLLARVYAGEGLLSTMLGIRGDDRAATRTEAIRIGEWAHQFASELRNG